LIRYLIKYQWLFHAQHSWSIPITSVN
jgi:hypothetical protein